MAFLKRIKSISYYEWYLVYFWTNFFIGELFVIYFDQATYLVVLPIIGIIWAEILYSIFRKCPIIMLQKMNGQASMLDHLKFGYNKDLYFLFPQHILIGILISYPLIYLFYVLL